MIAPEHTLSSDVIGSCFSSLNSMPSEKRENVRARFIGIVMVVALLASFGVNAPIAGADPSTILVQFAAEMREGANTTALSADGTFGFAAAYGNPEGGEAPTNLIFSAVIPSRRRLSVPDCSVVNRRSEIESVTIRLISSGIVRSNERRPAST